MLLNLISEAAIKTADVQIATKKIISYLEKGLGEKLRKLGTEHFKNSAGAGWGDRYQLGDSLKCIRFNWVSEKSSKIESVDFWLGNQHDPNFNITIKDTSFAKALPALLTVLKAPKVGTIEISAALSEAKKGEFTPESAVADMVSKLEAGRSFNRSEFVMAYHPSNAFAFDEFVEKNKDKLTFKGKRISLAPGESLSKKTAKNGAAGTVEVVKGAKNEDYEVEVPEVDKVSYGESLEHLEGLTEALTKGAFNALFIAGRGGTGKTQTVEDTLAKEGLSDGAGYFKITGSASPIGIYTTLYKYRDKIIMFDDCDGALETQDGRNIIKAATDTKKSRKIAWGKKSAGMYDPSDEAEKEPEDNEGEEGEAADTRVPNYFNFTGRIIFISNLPLNKLDPDGALRTRAYIISIDPTPDELIERMGQILHKIPLEAGLSLSGKERERVLEVIKEGKRKNDASLRTLVRALNLAASGAPNWEKLVKLYA
jgi:hypothetical protein